VSTDGTNLTDALTDTQVRELLTEYADAYRAQKAAEALAEGFKKQCAQLALQLEPAFADYKTLATDDFQLTRSVPESVKWNVEQAVIDSPIIKAMLAPYVCAWDVKKAQDELPTLVPMLAPYKTVTQGKPVFRATVKKA